MGTKISVLFWGGIDKVNKVELAKECVEITTKTLLSAIPVGGTLITCIWDSIKA